MENCLKIAELWKSKAKCKKHHDDVGTAMDLAGARLLAPVLSPIAIPNILNQVPSRGFNLHKTANKSNNNKPVISPSPGFRPHFYYKLQYQLMNIIPCCVSRSPCCGFTYDKTVFTRAAYFTHITQQKFSFARINMSVPRAGTVLWQELHSAVAQFRHRGLGDSAPAQIRVRGIRSDSERLGNAPIANITVS